MYATLAVPDDAGRSTSARDRARENLAEGITRLHGAPAIFENEERVRLEVEGYPPLERNVSTFRLIGHPVAQKCYAWCEMEADQPLIHCRTVLRLGSVTSPLRAIRAYILQSAEGARSR